MDFVKILGCGSALPVKDRNPSAQALKHKERFYLIDCGEGTQVRLREAKISFSKIDHIFISHLHGDHFFGLPGLLSSFHLLGRTKQVHLYGPPGLKEILDLQFKWSATYLNYELVFHPVQSKKKALIFESKSLSVYSFPLNHRIPCTGYLFEEKPKPAHLIIEKIEAHEVPKFLRANIKKGADFVMENGTVIPNKELTRPSSPPVSYAYCSDNRIKTSLKKDLEGVDVLYHETTFLDSEKVRAKKTYHSTAQEAAVLAKELEVKTLITGHYSARYEDLQPLLKECQEVFENVVLGKEGLEFKF